MKNTFLILLWNTTAVTALIASLIILTTLAVTTIHSIDTLSSLLFISL